MTKNKEMERIYAKDIAKEVYAMSALVNDLYGRKEYYERILEGMDDKTCSLATDTRAKVIVLNQLIERYEENR